MSGCALLSLLWSVHEQKLLLEWVLSQARCIQREGNSFAFSKSNLAVTTCRHFGPMVTSCAILTNRDLLYCAVSSKAWLSSLGQLPLGSSLHVWRGLSFSGVSLGNTVRAPLFLDILSHTYGALLTPPYDIIPISKLISAPVFPGSLYRIISQFPERGGTPKMYG